MSLIKSKPLSEGQSERVEQNRTDIFSLREKLWLEKEEDPDNRDKENRWLAVENYIKSQWSNYLDLPLGMIRLLEE